MENAQELEQKQGNNQAIMFVHIRWKPNIRNKKLTEIKELVWCLDRFRYLKHISKFQKYPDPEIFICIHIVSEKYRHPLLFQIWI
jgi:hypothetical protein